MTAENERTIFYCALSALAAFVLGIVVEHMNLTASWEEKIINREMGLYCPNTGKFAFTGECNIEYDKRSGEYTM